MNSQSEGILFILGLIKENVVILHQKRDSLLNNNEKIEKLHHASKSETHTVFLLHVQYNLVFERIFHSLLIDSNVICGGNRGGERTGYEEKYYGAGAI